MQVRWCACFGRPWFIPAARHFWLLSNRTATSGSVPEAILRTISLPAVPVGWKDADTARLAKLLSPHVGLGDWCLVLSHSLPSCPADLREHILARRAAGQPLVPERIARQIRASAAVVSQHRHPTDAALDHLSAPGSARWTTRQDTGDREWIQPGQVLEADDATINFPVCVPWTLGGDPCSDKFGVRVGRFQWLVAIDAASGYVPAYSYTMRPRSSYRGEDIVSLLRIHCRTHGIPDTFRFERGAWHSKIVRHVIEALGARLHTVWSPHQKPFIEGLFNHLWTKLSVQFPRAHIGRYQGEDQAANDLLTACQRGARDPRRHFPMLADALAAFRETVAEKNSTPMTGPVGRWVPEHKWTAALRTRPLRPYTHASDWLFSPFVREWTVRGMLIGGRVPVFEDLAVPFDFTAPWLTEHHGRKVRCHFDPADPRCAATLVLCESHGTYKAGEVLGLAQQINEIAGYTRLVMGWGDDPASAGRLARQQAAAALRREVRAILPKGTVGASSSEERDGVSTVTRIHHDPASTASTESTESTPSISHRSAHISVPSTVFD